MSISGLLFKCYSYFPSLLYLRIFEQTVGPNLEFVFLEMSLDYKLRNRKLRNRLPQEKFPNELLFVLLMLPFLL